MKRKLFAVIMSALLVASLGACSTTETSSAPESSTPSVSTVENEPAKESSTETEPTPETVNLSGEWEQVNKNSNTSYQTATITGDTITVYWIDTESDTKALYWAGDVTIPETAGESFRWESQNDTSQTANAIMASGDETKTFTYENGQISYDVSAMGMTQTVKLEKAS